MNFLNLQRPEIKRALSIRVSGLVAGLLLVIGNLAQASVVQVGNGYDVSYRINLPEGATPPGQDINNVFIFEWSSSQRHADFPYRINGSGPTTLSHVIPFAPNLAFVIGFIDAVPGAAAGSNDAKRHLYTLVDPGFSDDLVANHLGELFSQLFGQGEQYTIDQMILATQGNQLALDGLWSFVTTTKMADAAFDPAGDFRVHKWSATTPPIPEPSSIVLMIAGLSALLVVQRQRRQ